MLFFSLLSVVCSFINNYLLVQFLIYLIGEMNKFTKLNDREIEDILIEIPGDDGGLTDLKDINDNDLIEENNYLDFLDSSTNIQTSVINIMGM